jgi:hypothetical protein
LFLFQANQDLSSELNSVRAYYERSLEQISTLENGKKVTAQQAEFAMSERDRLKDEVDKLNTVCIINVQHLFCYFH